MIGDKRDGNENDDDKLILSRLKEETGIAEDVIQQNIDKMHPIGQPEDGKQPIIVNFTGNKFKKTVFMKYKQRKKACIEKEKKKQINQCQVQLSTLTHQTLSGTAGICQRKINSCQIN